MRFIGIANPLESEADFQIRKANGAKESRALYDRRPACVRQILIGINRSCVTDSD
jgi:hypothetical protein